MVEDHVLFTNHPRASMCNSYTPRYFRIGNDWNNSFQFSLHCPSKCAYQTSPPLDCIPNSRVSPLLIVTNITIVHPAVQEHQGLSQGNRHGYCSGPHFVGERRNSSSSQCWAAASEINYTRMYCWTWRKQSCSCNHSSLTGTLGQMNSYVIKTLKSSFCMVVVWTAKYSVCLSWGHMVTPGFYIGEEHTHSYITKSSSAHRAATGVALCILLTMFPSVLL